MIQKLLIFSFVLCFCFANECNSRLTCRECIQTAGCAWCSQKDVPDESRCFHPTFDSPYIGDVCSEEYVYFGTSLIESDDDKPEVYKEITPLKYSLDLRIGDPVYLSIKVNKTIADFRNRSEVEFHHNASEHLKVEFRCLNKKMLPISNCDTIKGSIFAIVKIQAVACPVEAANWKQDFIIYLSDSNDYMHIQVSLRCACPCEQKGSMDYSPKSKHCNSVGTLMCGICECDYGYKGKHCECSSKQFSNVGCKPPDQNLHCSGRGSCVCNKCHCDQRSEPSEMFYGKWCECDNFSCPRHNSELCSGNGKCSCGKCMCKPAWIGEACECSNSVRGCYEHFDVNSTVCNGHGDCVCGQCRCHVRDEKIYSGKYCEKCENCHSHCDDLHACVLCQAYKKGPYSEEELCSKNCAHNVTLTNKFDDTLDAEEFTCEGLYEDTCKYKFKYKVVNSTFEIKTEEELCLTNSIP